MFAILLVAFANAVGPTYSSIPAPIQNTTKAGRFDFDLNIYSRIYISLNVTPATGGVFSVSGTYDTTETLNSGLKPRAMVSGSVLKNGVLRANFNLSGKDMPLDGHWDAKRNTFVLDKVATIKCDAPGIRRPAPTVGMYEGELYQTQFNLIKSANADQMTVSGQLIAQGLACPMSGTYYVNRNAFTAFAKFSFPNSNKMISYTLDGRFLPDGNLRLALKKYDQSQELMTAVHIGPVGPLRFVKAVPLTEPAFLDGTMRMEKSTADIGETMRVQVKYSVSNADEASVQQSVTIVGPSGKVEDTMESQHKLLKDTPRNTVLGVKAAKEGNYLIKIKVAAPNTAPWEATTIFNVKPPKKKTDGDGAKKVDPNLNGSWGLVKKLVGHATPALETHYGTNKVGTVTENTLTLVDTPARPGVYTASNVSITWGNAPSTLKPGEIIEIGVSATASVSERDPMIMDITCWVGFLGGFENLEKTNAFIGHTPNGFVGSSQGKFRAKVPPGNAGELHIWKGQTGISTAGGNWYPCQYWYRWNAKPIDDDPSKKPDPKEAEPKITTTTVTVLEQDQEPEKKIKASLDKASLTLRAGEPSQIVDISISDFRTNTLDRVEVVLPQATDGWASLPGQIVAGGGGNGSYDPANMGRPVHTDGYLFSARSTAPSGKHLIDIIVRQKGAGQVKLVLEVTVIGRKPTTGEADKKKDWNTAWTRNGDSFSPLILKVNDGKVTGTMATNGSLEGSFNGDTLEFTFIEGWTGKRGKGSFTMSKDKKLIFGTYAYDSDPSKKLTIKLERSLYQIPGDGT